MTSVVACLETTTWIPDYQCQTVTSMAPATSAMMAIIVRVTANQSGMRGRFIIVPLSGWEVSGAESNL